MSRDTNAEYIRRNDLVEGKLPKAPAASPDLPREVMRFQLRAYRAVLGRELPRNAVVLDLGCGYGASAGCLLRAGYDAYGVDVLEYWGKDEALCGSVVVPEGEEVTRRLSLLDPETDRLPYPDRFFDLIVSDQVLEHVFDPDATFREQLRVLKPGGLAIHRFPNSHGPLETHTNLPFTALNRYRWYLALWAIAGRRNKRHGGLTWRETLISNKALYGTTHYLAKKTLLTIAQSTGFKARFLNHLPSSDTRLGRLYKKLKSFGIAALVEPFLTAISMAHVLILEAPSGDTPVESRSRQTN